MLEIRNTGVFGLDRALKAAGNAMTTGEINTKPEYDSEDRIIGTGSNEKDFNRGIKLGSAKIGSGHDHFLLGIHVQFDIKYPQYWTIEAERYHNFEIISSQSKMHKLTSMIKGNLSTHNLFNKYVDHEVIDIVQKYVELYNFYEACELGTDGYYYDPQEGRYTLEELKDLKYTIFMKALSNLPMGFEMWMTVDLSYLQIKTMYEQRKSHRLREDWGAFCKWCEELPMFLELTGNK